MPNATINAAVASAQRASKRTSHDDHTFVVPSALGRTESGPGRARDETRQEFENQEERGGGEADAHYVDNAYVHKVCIQSLENGPYLIDL